MKEKELRENATCGICKKKIGQSGVPMFTVVEIKRYVIDLAAATRQTGLGMMIGAPLAQVMGPDEDLAHLAAEEKVTVCEGCLTKPETSLAMLVFGEEQETT